MDASVTYQCHAFHESLNNGKASGQLILSDRGLEYRVAQLTGYLPFNQLELSIGGASDRLVFIKHPLIPDLTLYTSDLSILKNPVLIAHPECAPQINSARQTRHKNWAIFISITLIILAMPFVLLWKMDRLSSYAAKRIPVEWETKLGESVAAQYRLTHKLMSKEDVNAVLKPLTSPLLGALQHSPYQYDFTIVNDGNLNAFALPGGYVTINSGLILKADSAEELLGVLAHEISHVEERHGVRSILSNAGLYLIASAVLGDVSGILATVANAAPMLVSQTYSRSFESEADEKALVLMQRAKINPEGLPRFFEKMIAEEKAMLDKIENEKAKAAYKTAMTFLSTHPASEKRMERLRELIRDKNGETNNYLNQSAEFKALQEAVKKFIENSPTEAPTSDVTPSDATQTNVPQTDKSEKENNSESSY